MTAVVRAGVLLALAVAATLNAWVAADGSPPQPPRFAAYLAVQGRALLRCAVEHPRALLSVVLEDLVGLGPDPLPRVAASFLRAAAFTALLGVLVGPWLWVPGHSPPVDPDHPPVAWGRLLAAAARQAARDTAARLGRLLRLVCC